MTPAELAALHARSIHTPRPWHESEFQSLLSMSGVFLVPDSHGFALGRTVADETELLTIVVAPENRRNGLGRRLLLNFENQAILQNSNSVFLEVACDNTAAIKLYETCGYAETGRRKAYYTSPDGKRTDALIMAKTLGTSHQPA